jgi:hypothetical protein
VSVLVWAGQHRLWMLGIGIVALLVAAGAGVWFFVLRSPGTQVDLRQALRLYRQDERAGDEAGGGGRLPPAGVYAYRTSGGEELSFGGIGRQFPAASQMIVTDGGGCTTMTWVPLEQHTESLAVCPRPDGAYRVTSMSSYEMIAGVQTTTVIHCPAGTYLVPPDPAAGKRWHTTCSATGHQKVTVSGLVVGESAVDVGGRRLPALHTRLTLRFSGSESGTNPNNYWLSEGDALVLRQRETVDLSQDAGPLGSVRYGETMAIGLRSLEPAR